MYLIFFVHQKSRTSYILLLLVTLEFSPYYNSLKWHLRLRQTWLRLGYMVFLCWIQFLGQRESMVAHKHPNNKHNYAFISTNHKQPILVS